MKKRGPIWRPPNSEIRDPFWRSLSTWNPIWRFLLFKKRGPIWRPPNSETRDPFWRSALINLESHLAIPFNQHEENEVPSGDLQLVEYEIPSGDLRQLGISSGDSFYSI